MADNPQNPEGRQVGRLEWVVGALGAAIVALVLARLGYEAVTYREGAPVLVSEVVSTTPTEGGFVVSFRTENRGPSTAAEVVVRGRLKTGDRILEEAETTLDYVARKSAREAGLIFRSDPSKATLELEATAYRKP